MEYTEWRMRCAHKSEEKCLKTIEHIMDESNGHLDGNELDDLKDCWNILLAMKKCQHMSSGGMATGTAPGK